MPLSFGNFVFGSFGPDSLIGGARGERIFGQFGDDTIRGGAGDDRIFGGFGDDSAEGGPGDDTFYGGLGTDTAIFAGSYADYDIVTQGRFFQRVTVSSEAEGTDRLYQTEALHFTADDATIWLDGRNNAPILTAAETVSVAENTTAVDAGITVADYEGDAVTLSLEGADAGLFTLAQDGTLAFSTAPDYEAPADADIDNAYELTVVATDAGGAETRRAVEVTVTDVEEITTAEARINEFHYDNAGADTGEFVEVRLAADVSPADFSLVLYIGNGSGQYATYDLPDAPATVRDGFAYYVVETPGLQNGSPDGLALVWQDDTVVEFLSYEGSLTAADGPAAGMTSTDIGVSEPSDTPVGQSLQRTAEGDWTGPEAETRGDDNDFVPPARIVITEIMQNPSAVSDTDGEYFEVYNAGDTAIDLDGWTISDDGSDSHVISVPDGLIVAPGDYLVLARNGDSDANGGIEADYVYSGINLANGADEVILTDTLGREIDRVAYDGGPAFPDPNGASMELTNPALDNSDGTNWETADTAFGAGDLGSPGKANDDDSGEPVEFVARLNELHYDNDGADTGEFVEVRVASGADVSATQVVLYNGSNGASYETVALPGTPSGSDADWDYYTLEIAGIQNGAPDGVALVNGGEVIEFLSYGGTFTATNGPAAGMTSTDIGAAESGDTLAGLSLQRGMGDTWFGPVAETPGAANDDGTAPDAPVINELRISSEGASDDTSNFVELYGTPGQSFDGLTLLAVSGEFAPGQVDYAVSLDGAVADENGFLLVGEASNPELGAGDVGVDGLDFFGSPQTFLLVENFTGTAGEDLDTDDDGAFDGDIGTVLTGVSLTDGDDNPDVNYSTDVFGPDGSFTPAGLARATDGDGAFALLPFGDTSGDTPGATNETGDPVEPGETTLISAVQGSGGASPLAGQTVTVEAVVTAVRGNNFFLQEEDADADGDASTSEGVYVFLDANPMNLDLPSLGDTVSVSGTVTEYFDLTEIADVTDITVVAGDTPLPTPADIGLSGDTMPDYEAVEGMRIALSSATDDPLTVIENFNFDRFGQITVSAGTQTQPTQLYDPETEQGAIQQLMQANLNNRLLIDDGFSGQNPDAFAFAPAGVGDNGNGYIDSGDTFTEAGPTLRLGAEIDGPVTGVVTYGFGEYALLPDGILPIDEETNSGARPDAPADVGGDVQVAGFNVLNYFTTLDTGGNMTGPDGALEPRGATSAADLERQTAKLVDAALTTGAEVFALQEIENNGFGPDSAIATFVAALNAEAAARGTGQVFDYVDPTGGAEDAFLGTDAITTGLIYDTTELNLLASDYLVFDEPSAAATYDLADQIASQTGNDIEIGNFQRNRPTVAATFIETDGIQAFTVSSVHFKSKGDSGLADVEADAVEYLAANPGDTGVQSLLDALRADPNFDAGDGQGFWNGVRTDAAQELTEWFEAGSPDAYAGTGADDVLIIGDFNAYAMEDPTQTLASDEGYVDLIDRFIGQDEAYSYVFDGQRGTLDQAMASTSLDDNVSGLAEWHINADEPDLLSYNSRFTDAAFYSDGPFASSDHDPVIVGLDLDDLITT
ncbi:ExeM/NucH family extracellular endonuclease [Roseivivax marinus]|uniref:ExeM/NucH family extracellular endonuclease n=1 Tax=Roseivivax marinus TaxID=1379903 RepID=UPI00273E2602|nr:ExeM/NucH family extracellular endonuclease [Roseivivax marinus]